MERNHPLIYLYGNPNVNREEPAKVRIVYSRERNEPSNDEVDGEWICQVVSCRYSDLDQRSDLEQCCVNNYPTRTRCFRCQAFRAGRDCAVDNVTSTDTSQMLQSAAPRRRSMSATTMPLQTIRHHSSCFFVASSLRCRKSFWSRVWPNCTSHRS